MKPSTTIDITGMTTEQVYEIIYGKESDQVFPEMPIEIALQIIQRQDLGCTLKKWAKEVANEYFSDFD